MNITDFDNPQGKTSNMLEHIFARQKELMAKYHDIELKSGLMQTEDCPLCLHDPKGQARLKDFAWRITEEIGEATEALAADDLPHFLEEMVDALHFMVEQHILIGIEPKDYIASVPNLSPLSNEILEICFTRAFPNKKVYPIIENLALSMNCLKNKPWKQTHMMTDEDKFRALSIEVFYSWLNVMKYYVDTPEDIYNLYFRKSEVNKFRQRSNY